MKNLFKNIIAGTALVLATASAAHASLITVSMTADNVVGGGLCSDATCTSVTGWATYGSMANSGNWKLADTVTLNLAPGTYTLVVEHAGKTEEREFTVDAADVVVTTTPDALHRNATFA